MRSHHAGDAMTGGEQPKDDCDIYDSRPFQSEANGAMIQAVNFELIATTIMKLQNRRHDHSNFSEKNLNWKN